MRARLQGSASLPLGDSAATSPGRGTATLSDGRRDRHKGVTQTVQWESRLLADPTQRMGNPFRLTPIAPEHAAHFDHYGSVRYALEYTDEKL